jgi:hypothetical protein
MLTKFGNVFIKISEKVLDRSVDPEHLRIFIITRYFTLLKEIRSIRQDALRDLIRTNEILSGLKWISSKDADLDISLLDEVDLADKVMQWKNQLPNGKVINKSGLVSGTGMYMDWLETSPHGYKDDFIQINMEHLLRHVEVNRQNCLQRISPELSTNQTWLEKHDIAILFSRHTRRSNDFRFLNAALKMNDWYYPHYLKRTTNSRAARYMLALAEQELAIREVLK